MSERGQFRGGGTRGGGRGGRGDGGGYRGGGRGGHGAAQGQQQDKPKKENILDLSKYNDKKITVKFNGGREGTVDYQHGARKQATDEMQWLERSRDTINC